MITSEPKLTLLSLKNDTKIESSKKVTKFNASV